MCSGRNGTREELKSLLAAAEGNEAAEATTTSSPSMTHFLLRAPSDLRRSFHDMHAYLTDHTGRIGYLGSMAIACNSLTGPAMLHLPATFHRAGLIPTMFTLTFVCVLAALCSLHMANTISKIPGNSDFKKEVEYAETFRKFWGHRSFVFAQAMFFICITCLNISSIVDTAQTVDTALGNFKGTFGVQISWAADDPILSVVEWKAGECSEDMRVSGTCLPFFDDGKPSSIILTLGYVICVAIFLPMALMDLKENAAAQIVGFVVLLLASLQFCIVSVYHGLDFSRLSLWGETWSNLFGVVLFNFALVIAIPAWLYEKEESVDVPAVIHGSSALTLLLYILVGVLGTLSMENVSDNMLESMESGVYGVGLQIGASIFAFFIVGLGIPLFSVLTRYSLVGSNLMTSLKANVLAVYFPFGVGWLLYMGEGVTELLSWGGVIFTSIVAFILPLLVSLHTVEEFEFHGAIDVYSSYFPSLQDNKKHQARSLTVLIALAIFAIIAAIIGNIMGEIQRR